MVLTLYDLGDAAGRPVSPYCWRIRETLHLLGVPFVSRLLSLMEIRRRFTGVNRTVPILVDGEQEVGGSWQIAEYLSQRHDPEGRVFGGSGGKVLAAFVADWVDASVMGPVNRMIVKDIHDGLQSEDREYFRSSQEKRLGSTLEQLLAAREEVRPAFQASLHPVRQAIKHRPFIMGDRPAYGDFALHGAFQWANTVSSFQLLRPDDRLHTWISRMNEWLDR